MKWEKFRKILRPLFLIIGLGFFISLIVVNWQQAQTLFDEINWLFFGASIILAVLDNVVFSIIFYWLLGKYRFHTPYPVVGELFFLGQLAKYIPGRFWGFVYQATYFDHPKASISILFANIELTAVSVWRGLIIGCGLILLTLNPTLFVLLMIIGSAGFVWLIQIEWLPQLMQKVNQKAKSLRDDVHPKSIPFRPIVLSYGATVFLYLISNYVLLVWGFHFEIQEATLFIAFLSIAWVAGIIAFVMPAGIGVREAVFVFLVAQFNGSYSIETLTTIAIIYRFWQVFHEFGAIIIGFGFRRFLN